VRPLTRETVELVNAEAGDGLAERRLAAFEDYARTGMPSSTDAGWRYVELDLDLDDFTLAPAPGAPLADDAFVSAVTNPAGSARIVDGHVVSAEHDTTAGFGPGPCLLDLIPAKADKFAAAHLAFGGRGVVIDVPAGTVIDRPFVVDVQATQPGSISFPSVTVRAGADAEVSVMVLFRSPEGVELVQAPHLVVDAGDAARVRMSTAQILGERATSITHQKVRIGRDATVRVGEVGLGGRLARLDLNLDLVGAGSSTEVVGLYFGQHNQVLDYRMVMNHIGRNTSSDVFLKGAVEDEAQSVFTGLLRIERDAIRSSAFETNRNLVLSPGAKAHSVPNLEILCDDVMCGHGSSVGPLEEEHLYYLRSRGLSQARAERVLIRGFFSEVIDRLPVPGLGDAIRAVVYRRFSQAQAEGRLA
jgi:Fe-S cluster assembly protein SufD